MSQEEIERLEKEEFRLAKNMKEKYCDITGKETNPAKAAEILHQIGLNYRKRSPDKISLIKSAGLLNAAIVRNPSNVSQIKSDLSEVCRHILKKSKAKNQNADLIGKSEQLKILITKLRNEVKEFLENKVPRISKTSSKTKLVIQGKEKTTAIQELNKLIAHKYKQLMADLSQYCEDVMGKAPCEYAIVGMGSLAREEITPYSDFEHIILLFDDKNFQSYFEYFKWFSVIFHIIVLNVRETIVPSLNIVSLNDKESSLGNWFYDGVTTQGISFDGMMPHACKFPLGRQQHTKIKQFTTELIKPVSKMLEYLSSEADWKNGYHLADILTKTCFVFGNEDIFKQFVNGTRSYINAKSQTDTINEIKTQVKEDLNNFSTRFRLINLKSLHTINIKQLVYRSTTIFISALARKHNISANSCFGIIDEMVENNQITQKTAEKLQLAVAIACEMRLRVYMDKSSQCDNAITLKQDGMEKFLNIVGVALTINYFQIAYCLQCEVAKQLNFTTLHFYTDSRLINITIGLAFGIKDLISFAEDSQKQTWHSNKFDFDSCIDQLEQQVKPKFKIDLSIQTDLNPHQIKPVANYLESTGVFEEALEIYKQLLDIYESKSTDVNRDYNVFWVKHQIRHCLANFREKEEALSYLQRGLENQENLTHDDKKVATTLTKIGWFHINLHNYQEALKNLNQALEIVQATTLDADTDDNIADTLDNIGWCHIELHNYDEALRSLNRALEIKQNISLEVDKDIWVAVTQRAIGRCLIGLKQYDDSWNRLQQSLKICQNATQDERKDFHIAHTFNFMGECLLIAKQQYAEALICLQKAHKIYLTQICWKKDPDLATTLHNIGICLMELQEFYDALNNLKESLEIYENLALDKSIASKITSIRCKIDECLLKLG